MPRANLPRNIAAKVLSLSRRRCCLCFGLEWDFALKKGQIAHLDRNPLNNTLDNLAYLCLNHHDEYDSRPSQTKGLQEAEARQYRYLLYDAVTQCDLQPAAKLNDTATLNPRERQELVEHLVFSELGATEPELEHIAAYNSLKPLVEDSSIHDENSARLIWSLVQDMSIKLVHRRWNEHALISCPEFRISDISPLLGGVFEWFQNPGYLKTRELTREIAIAIAKHRGGRVDVRQGYFKRVFIDRLRNFSDKESRAFAGLLREQIASKVDVRVVPLELLPSFYSPYEISILGKSYAYTMEYNRYTHYIKKLEGTSDALDSYRQIETLSVPALDYIKFLETLPILLESEEDRNGVPENERE